jgi:DUF4097 and DUF4098 domain-containing protein YvlB
MKKLFLLAMLGVAMGASAEEWTKSYQVTGKPTLHVESDDAQVEVRNCDCKQIEARVVIEGYKPGTVKINESQAGDKVNLEVKVHPHNMNFHVSFGIDRRYVRVELKVPRESNLELHTSDGHIKVEQVKGDFDLETSDGHIEVSGADGPLRAHTSDGHIDVSGRFDALDLKSSDGSVTAEVQQGSKIAGAGWQVRTSDGRVRLRLPQDFSAELDARTGDGRVTTNLPLTLENFTTSGKNSLHGKLNGGGGLLTVRTSDGSITLDRL